MGDLKSFFSTALVRRLAADLAGAMPELATRAFIAQASKGLEALELLDRGKHIARAMAAHLPTDYPRAVEVLLKSLGPVHASDELLGLGMAPFYYYPHTVFVAERGLEHFDVSMRAQYELTQRFTCEGSIRPFIAKDPERVFALLGEWTRDPSPHVRRLVSEGTRLRLPWNQRVAWLDENPQRVIALLELLKDDPATVVRRSVANNLNDLSKTHPALLLATCEAWLPSSASAERRSLIEHALRTAVKRGDRTALKLLGFGKKAEVRVGKAHFSPERVVIGSKTEVSFELRSTSKRSQDLLVDMVVHFVKANGAASPKVFKIKRVTLAAGKSVAMKASVSLKVHTTRKPNPGEHRVDILVNGATTRLGAFTVVKPKR